MILTHLTLTATLWNRWLLFHFTSEELRHKAVKKFTPGVHSDGATAGLYTPATATKLYCYGITLLSFSSFHYALKHFINYSHLSLQTHLTLSLSQIYLVNLMVKPFYKFIHFNQNGHLSDFQQFPQNQGHGDEVMRVSWVSAQEEVRLTNYLSWYICTSVRKCVT